jgi:hypothetical protein
LKIKGRKNEKPKFIARFTQKKNKKKMKMKIKPKKGKKKNL